MANDQLHNLTISHFPWLLPRSCYAVLVHFRGCRRIRTCVDRLAPMRPTSFPRWCGADFVEGSPDLPGGIAEFWVGAIADIDEADLVCFAIAPP